MKVLITLLVALAIFVGNNAIAQNQAVLPNAGLTPESPFYFLDKFSEALREFFTFNPEGKARLQITFAAERIAEIKVILETKGVEARGLEVAQSRLQANLAIAATILDEEKSKGKDVSQLAKELGDEFEGPKSALEKTFKDNKRTLENQEEELKAKIRATRQAGDTAQVEALATELGQINAQKELLEQKEEEQEDALDREEERIEKELGANAEAEKKIRKAEREKQEVLDEAAEEGLTIPPEAFNAFERHLSEARSALATGKFDEARHHAKEAKESLDAVEDAVEDSEEAKEEKDELKKDEGEQKEKVREAQEKRDEKMIEAAEKDAERLEKEQKKAEKKALEAEKKLREAGQDEEKDD